MKYEKKGKGNHLGGLFVCDATAVASGTKPYRRMMLCALSKQDTQSILQILAGADFVLRLARP